MSFPSRSYRSTGGMFIERVPFISISKVIFRRAYTFTRGSMSRCRSSGCEYLAPSARHMSMQHTAYVPLQLHSIRGQ